MRINDLLRQQRHLADIVDPPALKLGHELQERSKLSQDHTILPPQFRLQDALANSLHDFNLTQRSVVDNVRQAIQPLEMLSAAAKQNFKNAELAGSDIFKRTTELAAVTKQMSERISLSATTTARIAEATRRSVEFSSSLSSFHQGHQRAIADLLRRTAQMQKVASANFALPHHLLTESATAMTRIAEAARRGVEFSSSLSSFHQGHQRAIADLLRRTAQMQKALRINLPPVLAFSSQPYDVVQAKNSLVTLDTSFTEEFLSWLRDAETTTPEPRQEEFLAYFLGWLAEKSQRLPQGIISLESLINILVTITIFLYSTWSDGQMEKRLTEKIINVASEKRIVYKTEGIRPDPTSRKRYVVAVTDRLCLRSEPSLKAPILAFLLPDTLVEEIEQHETWSFVEFSDHADGSVKKGWVYRDYLRAIRPEKG